MSDEHDLLQRRLTREDVLKLAALTGGAGLLRERAGAAGAAIERLLAESGRLQVLDWAGYGNDGGQSMFAQYVKQHPQNKPQFTYMTNESDALAKIPRRSQAGPLPAVRRLGEVLRDERPRAAVGHVADPELQVPEPVHGQGRPVQRQAVRHPGRLGFRRDPLPHRQGASRRRSPGASSSTSGTRARSPGSTTSTMLVMAGLYLGFKDPWNQTDAELKRVPEAAHLEEAPRPPDLVLRERPLAGVRSGDLWIATRGRTTGCR